MATSAPSSARRKAIACPRPRPEPVTSATSPFNENSLSPIPSPSHPTERLEILDAAVQLRQLIRDDRGSWLPCLPRRTGILIIIETLRLEPFERGRELSGGPRRVA